MEDMSPPVWTPKANPWLIAVVVALAAFLEVLDTSIANVALPHIAGNLGATGDESTWVLTSYLVSNAIVLPLSAWLAGRIGRTRFFMACIVVFTISSVLCGLAPTLPLLILARILQGAGGGGLQPMAQAILADTFPLEKRGLALAVYGVTAITAPAIGPTLGGWITDSYTWRWIFFINVPIGIIGLLLVWRVVEDPPYLTAARRTSVRPDYLGIALLVVGVSALQIMLDKGQQDDWFDSAFITTLAAVAALCLVSLVRWEWLRRDPVVDVRLFRIRNFAIVNALVFLTGAIFFSSLVILPQLLQQLMNYSALRTGLAMSAGGVVLLILMPIIGEILTKVVARHVAAIGCVLLIGAMYYTAQHLDPHIAFSDAAWLRVMQAVGVPWVFVSLSLVAYVGIPPEKGNSVSGILNFMRNIGSSVGTSIVTTLVARRSQAHQVMLAAHATTFNRQFRAAVQSAGRGPAFRSQTAYAQVYRAILAQATLLAYVDTFRILAAAAVVLLLLTFALKKNPLGGRAVPAD